jgi:hypothetical protein
MEILIMTAFRTFGRRQHAGKDLKDRPLRFIKSGDFTSDELTLAVQLLRELFEDAQANNPSGRPVIHVSEWERRCGRAGLERPGKFFALRDAAKSKGVEVDTEGRVHWGLFTGETSP